MIKLILPVLFCLLLGPIYGQDPYIAKVVTTHPADSRGSSTSDVGTGTYLDAVTILTAAHNVSDHREGRTRLSVDGIKAKIVYYNREHDVAILLLEGEGKLLNQYPVLGNDYSGVLTAKGYARGHRFMDVVGRAILDRGGKIRYYSDGNSYTMTGQVIQGMSGGPVINSKGELVGVIWGAAQGETFIVTLPRIRQALLRKK